jgi:KDO2-lipid IV(A) lauroyltransferase
VVIARPTEDPATTDLITMVRERCGYRVYERGNAARAVLKALRANEGVGILPDQNAGDVFVEFFGQKAGCVAGPAIFHLRTGAPIVPLFNVRLPGDYHRIEILPPIHFEPPECFSPSPVHSAGGSHPEKKILSGDWQADVQRIMQAWHDILESYVRRYPDQWLWLHDRWKSGRKLTAKTPA